MKITPELLADICTCLAADPIYSHAARRNGITEKTLWRWLRASADKTDERFRFEYMGETMWLHEAVKLSIKQSVLAAEAMARKLALSGWDEPVYFQGRPQYRMRDDIVAAGHQTLDADTLELLYGQSHPYEIGEDGKLVRETVRHRPSSQDIALVLRAHMPQLYGEKREITMNHNGGVLVLGPRGQQSPTLPPPSTPAQIMSTAVEEVMSEETTEVTEVEADFAEIETVEPALAEPQAQTDEQEPERAHVPVAAPAPALDPSRPITPLMRDLMERAAKRPSNPTPRAPVRIETGGGLADE